MKKKEVIDLITSLALVILALCILILPSLKITDLKTILLVIFGFYTGVKIIQFLLIFKKRDFESLFTSIISLVCLILVCFLEFTTKNISLIILGWMAFMCLIKLKKADFYHDRKNKMWILRLFILFVFLSSGLITGLNLMYESSVQIVIIGYFFLINSALDAIDPIALYLMENQNENSK